MSVCDYLYTGVLCSDDPWEMVIVLDTGCSWSELTRKLEVWVEIHELNDQGEYMPVEVSPKPEVPSGGVFQLRQVSTVICNSCPTSKNYLSQSYNLLSTYEKKY